MRSHRRHDRDDSRSGASGLDYRLGCRSGNPAVGAKWCRPQELQARVGTRGDLLDANATRAQKILNRLKTLHPDARCALDFHDEYELLVAVILSAQCTDKKVNAAVPALFERFPRPRDLATARPSEVEPYIRTLGLFRSKARHIIGAAKGLHEGVEWSIAGLTRLPGVGRKTANVVLSEARGIHEGIAVDTHCGRLARRFGLTRSDDPKRIERDLMAIYPRTNWGMVTHLFIAHGRSTCPARSPRCSDCGVRDLCPSAQIAAVSGTKRSRRA